ncbi:hypothetical protein PISL3812_00707 [Talaromyces islandicus]|uniref:Uncharacterized protein n=1 Tax=Talaromyces islandicus TaxID=28573 RepID=A0A0U1LLN4_TALIS|nr:hypothetical protein PISL3812_00707 [Talaromyces islandicus]
MSSTDAATNDVSVNTNPAPQTQVKLAGKVLASVYFNDPFGSMDERLNISAVTGANRGISLGIMECLDNGPAKVYYIDIGEPGEEFPRLHGRRNLRSI